MAMALAPQQNHPEDEIPENAATSRTMPKDKDGNQCRCRWASSGDHPAIFNFHPHLPKFVEVDWDGFDADRNGKPRIPSDKDAPSWRRWASLWRHMRCELSLPPLALGFGSSRLNGRRINADREWSAISEGFFLKVQGASLWWRGSGELDEPRARADLETLRLWCQILKLRLRVQELSESRLIASTLTDKAPNRLRAVPAFRRLAKALGCRWQDVKALACVNRLANQRARRLAEQMIYVAGSFFMLVTERKNSRDWADIQDQSTWISMFCADEISSRDCGLTRNKIIKFFGAIKLFGPYVASGWVVSGPTLSSLQFGVRAAQ